MQNLQREIRLKQALVLEDRQLLAARATALRARARRALATPEALLAGFGTGFATALLPGRRRPAPPAAAAAGPAWLQFLLRDMIMPLALGMLQTKLEQGEQPQRRQDPPR